MKRIYIQVESCQEINKESHVIPTPIVSADGNREYFWDDPRKVGSLVTDADGTKFYRGPGRGTSSYLTHGRLRSRDFIKGDDAVFLFSLEGRTPHL